MSMNLLGFWSIGSVIERFDSIFYSGQVVYTHVPLYFVLSEVTIEAEAGMTIYGQC